ncbi:flagellar hook-associated protein 3 FlgL [Paenibacillus sp. UNCCL117]|uniref:flagellar hook-associated protein FlgL n=1 Tax=unclassified Paenibacillus TaxID=185978 RepID=UPI00088A9A8D|nr:MULTISPECIES: flagellar hook-associated protein FlgL [unclassified Paenibacillus]SDE35253.1 flagellar hook-associated protein 3 FlgL [Paenibacillus sp. cl123]SFW64473.1 flagellar hook-associated protein 3 FlgL [Paenibacillus sp. UNCCL117]
MTQRVTQSMLNTQLLRNLNSNMNRMDNLQNQLATGRRINKPSDDPVGISFSLRYRSELAANDQYQRNVDSSVSWLDYTDTMLDQVGQVMQRARELAVLGSNGTNSEESLNSVKIEIDQLADQMFTIANSNFNGKYVFNGQKTDVKPYPELATAADVEVNKGPIQFEIGVGVKLTINKTGDEVFGEGDTSIFKILSDMSESLGKKNYSAIQASIGKIDESMNNLLAMRADIGAKTNRIQLAEDRLKDIGINLQSLQSKTEDADMSIVITNLKMNENVYQASLSAGSKLIQPTLIDFLR